VQAEKGWIGRVFYDSAASIRDIIEKIVPKIRCVSSPQLHHL